MTQRPPEATESTDPPDAPQPDEGHLPWNAPSEHGRQVRLFELAVVVSTVGVIATLLTGRRHELDLGWVGWGMLLVAVDLLPVRAWRDIQLLIDFPLLLALALLYRPEVAGAIVFISSFDIREVRGEVGPLWALFNRSQLAASAMAAGATFHALATVHSPAAVVIGASAAAITAGYLVNTGLVAVGASLLYQEFLGTVLRKMRIGRPTVFLASYLGLGAIGVALARLYLVVGLWAVMCVLIALVFAREMFHRGLALEHARAELATAYQREHERVRQLEMAERQRADLSRIVTHDFGHAIAALRTYAVTLRRRWADLDEAKRLDVVEWIERESGRLRELAEQIVSIMDLASAEPSVVGRPEGVVELLREAADAVSELDGRLKVTADQEIEGSFLYVDRGRILQVLRNLLTNAERYSEPGTPVELSVRRQKEEVVFSVRDTGPGIPPQFAPMVFEQFSRLPSSVEKRIPGSGLGLYIARSIVQAHGGRIWLDTQYRDGACFSFALKSWNEPP